MGVVAESIQNAVRAVFDLQGSKLPRVGAGLERTRGASSDSEPLGALLKELRDTVEAFVDESRASKRGYPRQ